MMQFPINNFAVTIILLICLGFFLGLLAFVIADEGEAKRAKERQNYFDALLKLDNAGLNARQSLISSALESMEDKQKH